MIGYKRQLAVQPFHIWAPSELFGESHLLLGTDHCLICRFDLKPPLLTPQWGMVLQICHPKRIAQVWGNSLTCSAVQMEANNSFSFSATALSSLNAPSAPWLSRGPTACLEGFLFLMALKMLLVLIVSLNLAVLLLSPSVKWGWCS